MPERQRTHQGWAARRSQPGLGASPVPRVHSTHLFELRLKLRSRVPSRCPPSRPVELCLHLCSCAVPSCALRCSAVPVVVGFAPQELPSLSEQLP